LERSVIFVLFNTFVQWRQIKLHINLSLIVDLIQENNLDRFEKKKPNKHRNKNTGNNRAEQVTKEPEAQKDNNRPEKTNAPKKFNKNKKRFPPKRNNND
jgi:hypothetical protein